VLVSKATIFGYGINLQTCAHVVTFASHSWEQHYQCVRRCWRFGQTRPVVVDVISTDGEVRVRESMQRKAKASEAMFAELVAHMQDATRIARQNEHTKKVEMPGWL
jgi:polynucleotide 5'-kinase involved in rRNA processing